MEEGRWKREEGSNCTLWGRREKTVDRREKKITSPGFCETTFQRNQKNESTQKGFLRLSIGRIVVWMKGKDTQPITFPEGDTPKTFPNTETI
jgi:hypothetical protein